MQTQPKKIEEKGRHCAKLPQFTWEEMEAAIQHFAASETAPAEIASQLYAMKSNPKLCNRTLLLSIFAMAIAAALPGSSPPAIKGGGFMN
jgi:hypothetical protein